MTDASMESLANLIRSKIREGFATKHLSKNLMDTIQVRKTDSGYEVDIPAEIYNMAQWWRHRVIVYNGNGSYAQQLDSEGSKFFIYYGNKRKWVEPRNHINFAEEAIMSAISEWMAQNGYEGEVSKE